MPLHADPRRGAGDDHGRLEIDEQGLAQRAKAIGLGAVVHRQRWHGNEFAQWRRWIGGLPHQVGQMLGVAGAVAKILRVDELQLLGNQVVAVDRAAVVPLPIEPDDRIDALAHLQRAAPFLRHIVRFHSLRSNHQDQSVARSDGVADLLVKGELPGRHRDPVEPDVEVGLGEIVVQLVNERLVVVPRVGEEERRDRGLRDRGLHTVRRRTLPLRHPSAVPLFGANRDPNWAISESTTYSGTPPGVQCDGTSVAVCRSRVRLQLYGSKVEN
ncbi:MAG: hypothetical protein ABSA52_13410 [Candidatus Binatia bacterium]|jgi:hypothetical protein